MIQFKLKNSKKPVGCWLDFYNQNGILQIGIEISHIKKLNNKDFILANHLYANSKTAAKISNKILHSWLYYNIDRAEGLLAEGASPKKNKEKAELSDADRQALRYDEIQYGVSIDDSVPDDEIQFRMSRGDTNPDVIVLNKKEADALRAELKKKDIPNDNLIKIFKD